MILAIYDLSGIQKFIFSTNKLTDVIGASVVVHRALFENIPELLEEPAHQWETEPFHFSEGTQAQIVYIGGGNALMLFDTEESQRAFYRNLAERVFLESGGQVHLFGASIVVDEKKSFSEHQTLLMQKLSEEKKNPGSMMGCPGFPVTAMDNNQFEPMVFIHGEKTTRSGYAKARARKQDFFMRDAFLPGTHTRFASQFELHRNAEGKNFIAVIHIDGNTMGLRIRAFAESQKGSIMEALQGMRKLSVRISTLYKNVFCDTLNALYGKCSEEIPVRPIIADGDDITLMIESKKAFLFTELFFRNLEEQGAKVFEDGFVPTAAAGIAFVKTKFPFSTAYMIAESLCKNAKKQTLEREGTAKNSMDFQLIYSGIRSSVSAMRKEEYIKEDHTLIRRPYVFDDATRYSYASFRDLAQKLMTAEKNNEIAVSKLKALRNAYGNGVQSAEAYGQYILAHASTARERELAQELSVPFVDGEAVFFDVLDVWDVAWEEK